MTDKSSVILQQDISGPPLVHCFHYISIVIKISFLDKCTRGNISYATHQFARFYKYPRHTHGDTIDHLTLYLCKTRDDGLILDPNHTKFFEVYTDTHFRGTGRDQPWAMTPWLKNHGQSTYYSTQGGIFYGILYCERPLYYLLQRQSMFLYHSHWEI